MKGDAKVIAVLSEALKAELTAINQYFLHAEMCEHWGYHRLADVTKKESIGEMKHAEILMERILLLEGTPNMSDYFKINIGTNVKQQLESDLRLELNAVKQLERRHPDLRGRQGQRLARASGEDPGRRGRAHRPPRRRTARHRRDRHRGLPGRAIEKRRLKLIADFAGAWPRLTPTPLAPAEGSVHRPQEGAQDSAAPRSDHQEHLKR